MSKETKDQGAEARAAAELLGDDGVAKPAGDLETAMEAAGLDGADDEEALRAEGIDPRHPILTVEEQRAAIKKARDRVAKDNKAEALKALEQQHYDQERGRGGLRTGDPVKDELVYITLDLAEHSDCLRINGHTFWHGQTYRLPRHVAESMREMQQRGHNHQLDLDGKGIAERGKKPRLTMVKADPTTGAVINVENAPQAAA